MTATEIAVQAHTDYINNHEYYQKFDTFLHNNWDLFVALVERARELKARGFKKYGFRALWEVARWDVSLVNGPGGTEYRLDSNLCPLLARAVVIYAPDLMGFFSYRDSGE